MTLWTSSPPLPSIHGIFQAEILEWVAMCSSRGSSHPRRTQGWNQSCVYCTGTGKFHPGATWEAHIQRKAQSSLNRMTRLFLCSYWKGKCQSLSHIQLFATPWTVAHQAPLSVSFSRQAHGVGCRFLLWGIFLTQRSNLVLLKLLHCKWILHR